jgi:hypothetical protein
MLILTEWRLGPIITAKSTPRDVQSAQVQVLKLYESFLNRIVELSTRDPRPASLVTVCTIPYYIWHSNALEAKLSKDLSTKGLSIQSIPEIYARKDQLIGRKILIIQ